MSERKLRIQRMWFNFWRKLTKKRKKSKKHQQPENQIVEDVPSILEEQPQEKEEETTLSWKEIKHSGPLAKANNELSLQILKLLSEEGRNVFISPFTIATCLSMLLLGAREETANELRKVLGADSESLQETELHETFKELLDVLEEVHQDAYTLSVANQVTYQKDFQLLPEYVKDLHEKYAAETFEVDFAGDTEKALEKINNWVKTKTRDMIQKIFDTLDESTVVVLASAVYFKGKWRLPFHPSDTSLMTFYNNGLEDQKKQVPMMFGTKEVMYLVNETYKVLELPYKGQQLAMLILLPNDRQGLSSMEKELEHDFLQSIVPRLQMRDDVDIYLPKFKLEFSEDIKVILEKLGVKTMFTDDANLKGMSEAEGIQVTKFSHKAVIDVNEEGSIAAAASTSVIDQVSDFQNPEFRANHPFIFIIYDKRYNLTLFIGKVEQL